MIYSSILLQKILKPILPLLEHISPAKHHSTDAHKTSLLAELVCSNSFRSDDSTYNAVGVLHEELRISKSVVINKDDMVEI